MNKCPLSIRLHGDVSPASRGHIWWRRIIVPELHVPYKNPQAEYNCRHQLAQALRLLGDTAEADIEAQRAVKTMEQITELSELNQSAIERPTDVELRLRIADLCDELGMKKLAVMWKKAAESCRQFAPVPERVLPSAK